MKLRALVFTVLAASLAGPSAALAQDAASAEALFERARQLMAQGKYADACPKLAESQRLDPGVGTLLNLGDCYDKNNQVSLAWATFREADAVATHEGQLERAKYARRRATELEKKLIKLTIDVPAASRVPGLEIRRDGEVIREPVWGTPLPIDPGTHVIEARAPGYKTTQMSIAVNSGSTVTIPPLEKLPDEPPPVVTPPPVVAPPPVVPDVIVPPAPPPVEPPPQTSGSGQRIAGVVVTTLGLAGVGVGGIFGALAMGRASAATSAGCDKTTCPTPESLQSSNDALTFARVSTWTFVGGAVVAAAGLVIFFTAPKSAKTTAWIAPALGGATLGGSF